MKSVNPQTKPKHKSTASSQRLVLESRLVFDGAIAVTATDTQSDTAKQPDVAHDKPTAEHANAAVTPTSDPAASFAADKTTSDAAYRPSADTGASQPIFTPDAKPVDQTAVISSPSPISDTSSNHASTVLVVDPRADNAANLLANPPANTQIISLDTGRDGFQQIANVLQGQHDISKVEILPWLDSNNTQWLGNKALTATQDPAVSDALTHWGDSFTNNAQIVFHGTNNLGASWLNHIDALTGANADWSQDTHISQTDLSTSPVQAHELIVVDTGVLNYQALINDINPQAEVLYIDSSKDGISQLVADLQGRTDISALHILSHGNQGELLLGTTKINSANIDNYQAQLAEIGKSLTTNGDILIYGCDVANGAGGIAFVNHLADLTKADIAASNNTTGAAAKGGDWILEYNTGTIEARSLVAPDYSGELAPVVLTPVASVGAVESQLAITTIVATNGGAGGISYSISGGADAGQFTINSATGDLSFVTGHTMAIPQDVGGNNVYDVQITATDGSSSATQALAVKVAVPNPNTANFGVATGSQTFFIPGSAEQMWYLLTQMQSDKNPDLSLAIYNSKGLHTVVTVAATADNTIVYYDQWEDGYDPVAGVPAGIATSTPIVMNGQTMTKTTYSGSSTVAYSLMAGQSIQLETKSVPVAPRGTSITNAAGNVIYDGGDRMFVVGGPVTADYAMWPEAIGTVFAMAWEIYPAKPDNTAYTIPIGENMGVSSFQSVDLVVQATQDNTTISFKDAAGSTILADPLMTGTGKVPSVTLNKGQSIQLTHVKVGTQVISDNPTQVLMVTGSTMDYESRAFSLTPSSLWSNDYYSPVPGGTVPTDLFLYNPGTSAINVYYDEAAGTNAIVTGSDGKQYTSDGYFTIAAGSTVQFSKAINIATGTAIGTVHQDSAVHLFTTTAGGVDKFWGVGAVDNSSGMNWGFSLVPSYILNTDYTFGWAPQWDFNNVPSTNAAMQGGKGSGIFVTPANDNTTIFIDYNRDGVVDKSITLNRLQTYVIYDPTDNDNTGTHIWATDKIAAAWGENSKTSQLGLPYLDMGYTALPLPSAWLDVSFGVIKTSSTDALLPSGAPQTVTYTLQVPAYQVLLGLAVTDKLASGWSYVDGSSVITLPDGSNLTGAVSNPLLNTVSVTTAGITTTRQTMLWDAPQIPSTLNANSMVTIRYTATTSVNIAPGANENDVSTKATPQSGTTPLTATDNKFVNAGTTIGDIIFNDLNSNGIQDAGEMGVAGVTVTLTQTAGGNIAPLTAVTDSNGRFLFEGLNNNNADQSAGTYTVTVNAGAGTPLANYSVTKATLTVTTGATTTTTAPAGVSSLTGINPNDNTHVVANFGFHDNSPNISGFVKYDTVNPNTTGLTSAAAGIPNVIVSLYLDNTTSGTIGIYDAGIDTLVATQTTNATGAYSFSGLIAGTKYLLVETNPAGAYVSTFDTGNTGTLATKTDDTIAITPVAGSNAGNTFLDYLTPPSISGTVQLDPNSINAGGLASAGAGISGVTVKLYDSTGASLLQTTTTDASGNYTFTGLTASINYVIKQTDKAGYSSTFDTQGSGTDNQITVASLSAAGSTGNTFLDYFIPPTTISGTVRLDPNSTNSGGLTNAGAAVAGVTVSLYNDVNSDGTYQSGTDTLVSSTTTDASGAYTFSGITALSNYVIVENDLASYTSTYDTQGVATDNQIAITALAAAGSVGNTFLDYKNPPSPTITKTVIQTSDPLTGYGTNTTPDLLAPETVTYELVVTVQDGRAASNLTITDLLPATLNGASLTFQNAVVKSIGGVSTTGATSGGSITTTNAIPVGTVYTATSGSVTVSGQQIDLDFGNVSTSNDGVVTDADKIVVWVTAKAGLNTSTIAALPTPLHYWTFDGLTNAAGVVALGATVADTGSSPQAGGVTAGTGTNTTLVAGQVGSNALQFVGLADAAATANAPMTYVDTGATASALGIAPTNTNFTITAWFKGTDNTGLIVGDSSGALNPTKGTSIYFNGSGAIQAEIGGTAGVYATSTYADNNWHMAALSRSGTTATLSVYSATGVLEGTSVTFTPNSTVVDIGNVTIGGRNALAGQTSNDYDGTIDDVRIYNSALTATQLVEVASLPIPSHRWTLANNTTDTGTNATKYNGTLTQSTGATPEALPTYVADAGTQVLNLGTGTDDSSSAAYVKLANDTQVKVDPTDTYTVSLLFKLDAADLNTTAGTKNILFANGSNGTPDTYIGINTAGALFAYVGSGAGNFDAASIAGNVADGQWHLVTLTHNAVSHAINLYLDAGGAGKVDTVTGAVPAGAMSTAGLILGAGLPTSASTAASWDFDGSLADVRVYEGTVFSATQVARLYADVIFSGSGSATTMDNTGKATGVLTANEPKASVDVIPTAPTNQGGIRGQVRIDSNNSGAGVANAGLNDAADVTTGLSGFVVTLTPSTGSAITTTTDFFGSYEFGGLATGLTYTVSIAAPYQIDSLTSAHTRTPLSGYFGITDSNTGDALNTISGLTVTNNSFLANQNFLIGKAIPSVDLDTRDGTATNSYSGSFTFGSTSVPITWQGGVGVGSKIADNQTPTAIANLNQITVTITNAAAGDSLSVGSLPAGISLATPYTYNAGTGKGTLVLSGVSSLANYETALEAIRFSTTTKGATTARTIDVQGVADNGVSSNTAVATISIIDTVPVAVDNGTVASPAITTTEDHAATITVATLVGNDTGGEGPLTLSSITANPANGTLSINSGVITYTPNAGYFGNDSFTYKVADSNGDISTNSATVFIAVTPAPRPAIDLNTTDGAVATSYAGNFVFAGGAVSITAQNPAVNTGSSITETGVAPQLNQLTVTLTNRPNGAAESLSIATLPAGILLSTPYNPATGQLVLSGAASLAAYETALEAIRYDNSSSKATLDKTARIIDVQGVDTNGKTSNLAVATIAMLDLVPIAKDDNFTIVGDSGLHSFAVMANNGSGVDIAGDGASSIIAVTSPVDSVSGVVIGTAVINGTNINFTPDINYNGTATFNYTITDINGDISSAKVTVTVTPVNHPVTATPDSITTPQNLPVAISVLTNDSFPDGRGTPVFVSVVAGAGNNVVGTAYPTSSGNGTVTINVDGTLTYTPNASFVGTDTFNYTIQDKSVGGVVDTATALVTVNVTANLNPLAVNDAATVPAGQTININVLGNDNQGDAPAIISVVGVAAHGTTALNSDGTIKYTSNGIYAGSDSFTYTIRDKNGTTSTATVNITITNTAPVAKNDVYNLNTIAPDGITIINNLSTTTINGLLVNDFDADGAAGLVVKNYSKTDGTGTVAAGNPLTTDQGGTVTVNADGTFTYTRPAGFTGTDSFSYTITDPVGATSTATVTLLVTANHIPVAHDDSYTAFRNSTLTVNAANGTIQSAGGAGKDTDADATDVLTVNAYTQSSQGGIVAVNPDGSFSYTPKFGFMGTDTFQYQVTDGNGGTSIATVSIDVTNAPPVANNDTVVVQSIAGSSVTIPILNNDTDSDGTIASVRILALPATGGTLYMPNGTTSVMPNQVLTIADANALVFKPTTGYTGSPTFTYTVTDNDGAVSNTAIVTVQVVSAPTVLAVADSATTNVRTATTGNQAVQINLAANDSSAPNALDLNSISVNGSATTIGTSVTVAGGTVVLDGNGKVTFTPDVGYTAPVTFNYTIKDSGGVVSAPTVVTVTVNSVNAVADFYDGTAHSGVTNNAIPQNSVAAILNVLSNDNDPNGDTFTIVAITQPTNGFVDIDNSSTNLLYTPKANWTGTETLTYTIQDSRGNLSTATVTVTVAQTGNPPVIDLDANNSSGAIGADYKNTFVIGSGAVRAADTDTTLTDPNVSQTMASASIVLNNVQNAGQEFLAIASLPASIAASYSYDSATQKGTLSLTGAADISLYKLAIANLTYNNTATTPTVGTARDITVIVTDAQGNASNTAHSTITLITPPALDLDNGVAGNNYAGNWTVAGGSVVISASPVISDADSANMSKVTISLTNAQTGDSLSVVAASLPAGITVDAASTATNLILIGADSKANYNAALALVKFDSTGTNTTARVINVVSTDDTGLNSNTAVATLTAHAAAPALDLDNGVAGNNYAGNWTVAGGSVVISASPVISDADSANMSKVTISLTNAQTGDSLSVVAASLPAGITVDAASTATNLILIGADSKANYNAALALVKFDSTGTNTTARVINVVSTDDTGLNSNTAVATLTAHAAAPALDLDNGVAGNNYAGNWTVAGGSVVISASPVISDADSANMSKVTISLTNAQTGDSLSVVAASLPAGISVDAASTATNLILIGADSKANYNAALALVKFDSTGTNTTARVINVVSTDDTGLNSNTAVATLTAHAAAPALDLDNGVAGNNYAGNWTVAGGSVVISASPVISDADSANMSKVTISLTNAQTGDSLSVVAASLPAGITVDAASTATNLILIGADSKANYNAALALVKFDSTGTNTTARVINVVSTDDTGLNSNTAVATLTAHAAAPALDLDNGVAGNNYAGNWTVAGGSVVISASPVISDADSANMSKVTISLTNAQTGDSLSVVAASLPAGITVDAASTATNLILIGADSKANYNAALALVKFDSTGTNTTARVINVVSTDDTGLNSNTAVATLTAHAAAPALDLDNGVAGNNYAGNWTVAGGSVVISASPVISDADSANMSKVTISLTNAQTGDSLSVVAASLPAGITVDAASTATNLILIGADSKANYNAALALVKFDSTGTNTTARVINVVSTDDTGLNSNTAVATLTAHAAAPALDLDNGVAGNNYAGNWTVAGGSVVISASPVISDADSANMSKVTISLTNAQTGDSLSVVAASLPAGITVDAASTATNLILIGADSKANYNAALALVKFDSTGTNTTARVINVVSTDDTGLNSNTAVATLTAHAAANQPPVINFDPDNSGGGANDKGFETSFIRGGVAINVADTDAIISDSDNIAMASLTLTAAGIKDGVSEVFTLGGVTFPQNADKIATVIIAGTPLRVNYTSADGKFAISNQIVGGTMRIVDLNTLLRGISYQNSSATATVGDRTLSAITNDGTADSNTAVATITVKLPSPTNQPPVNSVPTTQTVVENVQKAITGLSVSDANTNLTSTKLTVTGGKLNVTLSGGVTITAGNNDTASLTLSGGQAAINTVLGTLKYTSNVGTTNDSVTVLSTDATNLTDSDSFAITVDRLPIARNDTATYTGAAITVNVLANDTTGDTIVPSTVQIVHPSVSPDGKTLTLTGVGEWKVTGTGAITFTPVAGYTGIPSPISYRGRDAQDNLSNTATLTLIPPTIRPPIASNDIVPYNAGTTRTVNVLANDTTGSLIVPSSVKIISSPAGGTLSSDGKTLTVPNEGVWTVDGSGAITFTPATGFIGTPTAIMYTGKDAQGNTSNPAIVTLDRLPIASNDTVITYTTGTSITVNVLNNDTTGDTIVPSSVKITTAGASNGGKTLIVPNEGTWTVDGSGAITFTPVAGFIGTPSPINYTGQDAEGNTSNVATVSFVDRLPIASPDTVPYTVGTTITVNVLGNDTTGDTIVPSSVKITTAGASNGGKTLIVPNEGTWTVDGSGAITFTPVASFTGTPSPITYTGQDAQGNTSNATTVTLVTNRLPIASDDTVTYTTGSTITVNVLNNDTLGNPIVPSSIKITTAGVSGDGKTLIVPNQGTWTVDGSGAISFTPVAGFTGTPSPINYTGQDAQGKTSNVATVSVVDRLPIASDDTLTYTTGTTITVNVLGNDTTGDTIVPSSVKITTAGASNGGKTLVVPNEGTWTVDGSGAITFTPVASFTGVPTPISYTGQDAQGNISNSATVTLTMRDRLPIASDDTLTYTTSTSITVNVLGNDTTGDTIVPSSVKITTAGVSNGGKTLVVPNEGTWTVDSSGAITFTPVAGFTGVPTAISYTGQDAQGNISNSATVTLIMRDRLPIASDDTLTYTTGTTITVNVLGNDTTGDTIVPSSVKITTAGASNGGKTLIVPNEGTWTVDSSGAITFTPVAGFTGVPTPISYTGQDAQGNTSNTATVSFNRLPDDVPPATVKPNTDTDVNVGTNEIPTAVGRLPTAVQFNSTVVSLSTAFAFADVDSNNVFSYLATGLPAGLSINPVTGVITGTLAADADQGGIGGLYAINVIATDSAGAAVTQHFNFIAQPVNNNAALTSGSLMLLSNTNQNTGTLYVELEKKDWQFKSNYAPDNELPPVHLSLYVPIGHHVISLTGSLRDQVVVELERYSFNVPRWLFRHTDPNEQLEFSATRSDGSPLPEWLKFDRQNLRFLGIPPKGAHDEIVMVTARDSYGNEVHTTFTVHVMRDVARPANRPAITPNRFGNTKLGEKPVVGKSGLSEQVQAAGKLTKLQESRALLDSLKQL